MPGPLVDSVLPWAIGVLASLGLAFVAALALNSTKSARHATRDTPERNPQ